MQEKLLQLKQRMDELIRFKNEHIQQQVKYPIDGKSKELIRNNLLIATGEYGGEIQGDVWLEIEYNGKLYWMSAMQIT